MIEGPCRLYFTNVIIKLNHSSDSYMIKDNKKDREMITFFRLIDHNFAKNQTFISKR